MLFAHRDAVASSAGGRWKYFERKKKGRKAYGRKKKVGNATVLLLSLEAFLLYTRVGLRNTLTI